MATNTWEGGTDALWNTITNWSEGHIPIAGEDVDMTTATGGTKCGTGPGGAAACLSLTITTGGAEIALDLTGLVVSGNMSADNATDWDLKLTCNGILTAGTVKSGTFTNVENSTIKGPAATCIVNGTATNCTITGGYFNNITNTGLQTLDNFVADLEIAGTITLSGAVAHLLQNNGIGPTFTVPNTVTVVLLGDATSFRYNDPLNDGPTVTTTSGTTQSAADVGAVTADKASILSPGSGGPANILGVVGTYVPTGGGNVLVV